ncbi:uncharacterized protein LOC133876286 [Alnus glutinosa]|uniref:uncharacterized protein LOC133876286 n=1 Tax=Alnus glutinosa TaxID=3517 RepID=UPI002D77CC67|nr:uncharacterized protein LOC133876286 [Alnus glutinosa]
MCVDFTDLNKACPKDSFPLAQIDLLVDSTFGHELLSFMDAFSGYNQIYMEEANQEKTTFITDRGLYYYKMMPFGLKNAGATYQRLVNKMFQNQIGRNVEVYVDDMLVKISPSAESSALVREDSGIQKPVYFTSTTLHGAEERYPRIEKLAFALVISARRLRPYFQAHAIRVLTEYPMKKVLADFLVEFCNIPEAEELPKELTWVVFVDGSLAHGRSRVGVLLRNPEGQEFDFAVKLDFVTINNEAKYEAVIAGLALSREMGATNVEIRSDSQVVVGQVQGQFEAQEDRMARYLEQVRRFQSYFERVFITKIPRDENIRADEFSKIASGTDEEIEASKRQIIILTEPSITPRTDVMEADPTQDEPKWAIEIIQFLRNGLLPEDKVAAQKVKIQATRFCLLREVLYKRGYSEPLLKCLSKTEADYVLKEIHEGVCGDHSGGRMMAQKTIRAGYYWPTIRKDSALLVKTCDKCQRFSRIMKSSLEKLTPLTSPWPFAKWGVDIVGPMPVGKRGRKFLVIATRGSSLTVNHSGGGVQNFVSETIMPRHFIQRRMVK